MIFYVQVGDKEDCHPVERTVYKDECVPYVEKTCFTQQKELCQDIYDKNCTAVIDEFEDRECFDVTELMCQLVENIQYEMVEETYTVQRCTRVTDRVCDTVYDLSVSIFSLAGLIFQLLTFLFQKSLKSL